MDGSGHADDRWQVEQALALAPTPSVLAAALPLATPTRWQGTGCDAALVWGRCTGGAAEPYDTVVHHVHVASRCSCPSRVRPCKHAVGLMLLWAHGHVPRGTAPRGVASWGAGVTPAEAVDPGAPPGGAPDPPAPERPAPALGTGDTPGDTPAPTPPTGTSPDPATSRDERIERMRAGLAELNRWLDDRVRTGLADPALARYATWDDLATRLVDSRVQGLANRVRRLGGVVGTGTRWHEHLLAEMGMLHLLASAGLRLAALPPHLADSVAVALGWQVRQADVLAGVPHTDHWAVLGRSDTREDRIEVRRVWLRGATTGRWAMLLSFAAYGQSLDDSWQVGTQVHADLCRYPGLTGLRALEARRHDVPVGAPPPRAGTVADACDEVGGMLALEPWLERLPLTVLAAPAVRGGGWVLTDHTGSLPLVSGTAGLGTLVACSGGQPLAVTCEWTPAGLVPLTAHLADRTVDLGPVADPSFVQRAS